MGWWAYTVWKKDNWIWFDFFRQIQKQDVTGGDVMGLLGRQKIYTDVEKIDKNNVVDVLQKAYAKHRQNVLDIQYLIDYERGEQPLKRQKTVRADIDI